MTGAAEPSVHPVPGAEGLQLHLVERPIAPEDSGIQLPAGTRSVSVFLVNHRTPDQEHPDRAYAFQAEIEVRSAESFVPRPDLRGAVAEDWDEPTASS